MSLLRQDIKIYIFYLDRIINVHIKQLNIIIKYNIILNILVFVNAYCIEIFIKYF